MALWAPHLPPILPPNCLGESQHSTGLSKNQNSKSHPGEAPATLRYPQLILHPFFMALREIPSRTSMETEAACSEKVEIHPPPALTPKVSHSGISTRAAHSSFTNSLLSALEITWIFMHLVRGKAGETSGFSMGFSLLRSPRNHHQDGQTSPSRILVRARPTFSCKQG